MILSNLRKFYVDQGLHDKDFHIGPEHPGLEEKALLLVKDIPAPRILEIGYQSGGFSIPMIVTLFKNQGVTYEGIDNLEFNESINSRWQPRFLEEFLEKEGVDNSCFTFNNGDGAEFLKQCDHQYDLILIDHLKALYPRELKLILQNHLIKEGGFILLHDVSIRAKVAWEKCSKICDSYGCQYEVDENVVSGLAIVKPGPKKYRVGIKGFFNRLLNLLRR